MPALPLVLEISQYLGVKEAVGQVLAKLASPQAESVPSRKSFGRVAAEDIVSKNDVPPFSTSHMDGFAFISRDTKGASEGMPAKLNLVGSLPVGRRPRGRLAAHEAIRVSTGSFLPEGADAVVPAEDARRVGGRLLVPREVSAESFVFKAGEDVKKGGTVVRKGDTIRAQDVGLLVAIAIRDVTVWHRPRVAILATGNELTNSMSPQTTKTRNSHAPVFALMARALGCEVFDLGIAPDRVGAILGRVGRGLQQADVVFMTGGTSVGKLDLADDVLKRLRPQAICHGIRMDRGRVAGVAVVKGKGIVMMPGPMQGAMNAFLLLGLPMLQKLSGRTAHTLTIRAKLTRRWEARKRFPNFTKVVYLRLIQSRSGTAVEPLLGETESISLLTESNAYTVVPEGVTAIEAGHQVDAHLLPGFSFAS